MKKIYPIQGNVLEHELGICNDDLEKLKEEVSIIFHSAATVKFDEPLR
jgi:fatty acyl-CoA reductase